VNLFTGTPDEALVFAPADPNPLVRTFGRGPDGKRCKDCRHFYVIEFANRYFKCRIRGNSGGPATDHRANWKTCAKFEEAE